MIAIANAIATTATAMTLKKKERSFFIPISSASEFFVYLSIFLIFCQALFNRTTKPYDTLLKYVTYFQMKMSGFVA